MVEAIRVDFTSLEGFWLLLTKRGKELLEWMRMPQRGEITQERSLVRAFIWQRQTLPQSPEGRKSKWIRIKGQKNTAMRWKGLVSGQDGSSQLSESQGPI